MRLTHFKLITTGCMKGGYDYNEEDQYEEPLDPSSTVDFHMKGLKGKYTSYPKGHPNYKSVRTDRHQ